MFLKRVKKTINFGGEATVIALMMVLLLGSGLAHAAFYRTAGDEGFEYGYGFSADTSEYGYGWGYLVDGDHDKGFLGDDGKATDISASTGRTSMTVSYTTDYQARNRILYGKTASLGSQSSQTGFQMGSNSITVSGLSCGTTYHYRVETTDAGENVWYSTDTSHTVKTSACPSGGGGGVVVYPDDDEPKDDEPKDDEEDPTETDPDETLPSGLSSEQADSVVFLLKQFGVSDDILERVRSLLYGEDVDFTPIKPAVTPTTFERDLTVGSRGADVRALQRYLNRSGFDVASTGPGSKGNETEYFGPLTQSALARFQEAKGINPPMGYFGPITRAFLGR